ncbi:ABC transporter permease [Kitasatospora sp. McL0602]|uniref:ABC transporter permease n=1 Tax=Kitasatospora sp. McL0602 TaxID=3439530 RepID=UPI003F8B695E
MIGPRAATRFVVRAWWLHLKELSSGRLYLLTAVVQPVVFATIALLMFHDVPGRQAPVSVALGAGLLGMWAATLFGSGAAITRHRWMGTLEGLVASPTPLILVLLPVTVASACMGLYSLLATFGWGVLFFGVPMSISNPALFAVSVLVTVLTLGLLGLLVSAAFVLYPAATALSNAVEFPIALLSGVLVPVSALPQVLRPLSYVLAPMWGIRAIRAAALGGGSVSGPLLMCAALSVCYVALAVVLLNALVNRARGKAKLALA